MRPNLIFVTLWLVHPATDLVAQVENHTVSIVATVGGKAYQSEGPGLCKHFGQDPDFPTWMAHYNNPEEAKLQLDLTYGKNKGSEDRLSLTLVTGATRYEINTLIPGKGAGSATVSSKGAGGRFEIKGKDSKGTAIKLTVDCATFDEVEAEAG